MGFIIAAFVLGLSAGFFSLAILGVVLTWMDKT